jgi:hypothetical protein
MSKADTIEMLLERNENLAKECGLLQAKLDELLCDKNVAYEDAAKSVLSVEVLAKRIGSLISACLLDPDDLIGQISAMRELTGFGLKDAKDAVISAWQFAGKSTSF